MAKEDRAAVIAAEQRAVDHAYNCLERKMQETKRLSESPAGASAKDNAAQRREFQKRLASYEDLGGKSLVFARVDVEEGEEPETFYLGRRAVRDGDRNLVVIDWRTDTAIRWRKASQRNPGEVRLRRRLRCHAHQVVDFFDEVAAPERAHPADPEPGARPSPVTVEAAIANTRRQESDHESVDPFLLEELARVRDGHMRDIVETIQRAQLDLVSDDRPGVLIVQGGPGTGKTAIGLHRVSWLLGNERVNKGISADEILVVGPHQGFLDYVSQVLPILDSRGVATVQLRSLWREEPAGTDTDQQRLIKSDLRMVRVLHRAVANSVRPYALDRFTHHGLFETVFEGTRLAISREELGRLLTQARGSNGAFDAQRSRFAEALTDHLMREAVGLRPSRERDSRLRRRIKESTDVRSLLNAVWPKVSEDGILRRLLNDAEELHAAASGILTDEEQRVLLRPR
ncbi:helicase domain-containing protein [Allosalinactinospora lopnorensis]|uniref:hypothetical protein n=1 Tax=Allosalinactinospora lopnorensis TaxID=1352348 RepID=UPI000697D173|nr:hypothetical protein [Allosalinactinospora lopnorensis]